MRQARLISGCLTAEPRRARCRKGCAGCERTVRRRIPPSAVCCRVGNLIGAALFAARDPMSVFVGGRWGKHHATGGYFIGGWEHRELELPRGIYSREQHANHRSDAHVHLVLYAKIRIRAPECSRLSRCLTMAPFSRRSSPEPTSHAPAGSCNQNECSS